MSFLKYKRLKLKLRVLIKSGNNKPSKSTSWKVLETVLSHLNLRNKGEGSFKSSLSVFASSYQSNDRPYSRYQPSTPSPWWILVLSGKYFGYVVTQGANNWIRGKFFFFIIIIFIFTIHIQTLITILKQLLTLLTVIHYFFFNI